MPVTNHLGDSSPRHHGPFPRGRIDPQQSAWPENGTTSTIHHPVSLSYAMQDKRSGAEHVRWNLADLYPTENHLKQDLEDARSEAESLAGDYRGKVASLPAGPLREGLERLEYVLDKTGRASTYAFLRWSVDTGDPAAGALLQHVREACTATAQELMFFDLEWARTGEEHAAQIMEADALSPYRHHLEVRRLQRDYMLSEPEEKILAEKAVTGREAWIRFFDETLGAARFQVGDEALTEQETLAKLHEPDREVRRQAVLALTEGLAAHQHMLTSVFNTTLADKASDDRLRGYPHWLSERNLSNEVSDETVNAVIKAVTARYDLVARFYRLKRRLLGYETLFDYDRYAPLDGAHTQYGWDEARAVAQDAYTSFHPRLGRIAELFFERNWIDAPPAPGKRGGAFSHGAVPSAHPYILLNFTGKPRDVQTLAHELGHGVHQYLSREQGVLQAGTPLTTAETASVFGEMIVFRKLLDREEEPTSRLAMLIGKIDDTMATVFRQIAMNQFEDAIHTARRTEGELSPDRFADCWMGTQERMFQGSVTLGPHYRHWWSYIPHFVHTPGYVYAYAFGELLVLALHARYLDDPEGFPARYVQLLEAGGSDWPHLLVRQVGVDIQDPTLWNLGLDAIERLIIEAENIAEETGRAQVSRA